MASYTNKPEMADGLMCWLWKEGDGFVATKIFISLKKIVDVEK